MKPNAKDFHGKWRIHEMEDLDEEYLSMQVKPYILIQSNNLGEFQFGLVTGQIDGKIIDYPLGKRFEFTWEGSDECDPASGFGWLTHKGKNLVEGEIRFHLGDSHKLLAKRVKKT